MKWSLEQASVLCHGKVRAPANRNLPVATGLSIDTRTLASGDLFVALTGEQADGHRFVEAAFSKGASAALVKKEWADAHKDFEKPLLCVDDPLLALQAWARRYRREQGCLLTAVTGSAGKTSTKEMIYAVLASRFRAQKTEGNYNNHIGLPLTLLQIEPSTEAMAVEMGANHAGEIALLSEIARPNIGVITNIGTAHIGLFGSREKIAEAKYEMAQNLLPDGVMIINGDDDFLPLKAEGTRGQGKKAMMFAIENPKADLRAENVSLDAEARGRFTVAGVPFHLQTAGMHSVGNAMAAVTVGVYLGIPLESIAEALAGVSALAGRWTKRTIRGVTLIDDSYNANPASVCASLTALARTQTSGRRIAVLGDMLELGDSSSEFHARAGAQAAMEGLDLLVGYGRFSDDLLAGARAQGALSGRLLAFTKRELLTAFLSENLRNGDLVLFKGSHAMRLDKVIDDVDAQLRSA